MIKYNSYIYYTSRIQLEPPSNTYPHLLSIIERQSCHSESISNIRLKTSGEFASHPPNPGGFRGRGRLEISRPTGILRASVLIGTAREYFVIVGRGLES